MTDNQITPFRWRIDETVESALDSLAQRTRERIRADPDSANVSAYGETLKDIEEFRAMITELNQVLRDFEERTL